MTKGQRNFWIALGVLALIAWFWFVLIMRRRHLATGRPASQTAPKPPQPPIEGSQTPAGTPAPGTAGIPLQGTGGALTTLAPVSSSSTPWRNAPLSMTAPVTGAGPLPPQAALPPPVTPIEPPPVDVPGVGVGDILGGVAAALIPPQETGVTVQNDIASALELAPTENKPFIFNALIDQALASVVTVQNLIKEKNRTSILPGWLGAILNYGVACQSYMWKYLKDKKHHGFDWCVREANWGDVILSDLSQIFGGEEGVWDLYITRQKPEGGHDLWINTYSEPPPPYAGGPWLNAFIRGWSHVGGNGADYTRGYPLLFSDPFLSSNPFSFIKRARTHEKPDRLARPKSEWNQYTGWMFARACQVWMKRVLGLRSWGEPWGFVSKATWPADLIQNGFGAGLRTPWDNDPEAKEQGADDTNRDNYLERTYRAFMNGRYIVWSTLLYYLGYYRGDPTKLPTWFIQHCTAWAVPIPGYDRYKNRKNLSVEAELVPVVPDRFHGEDIKGDSYPLGRLLKACYIHTPKPGTVYLSDLIGTKTENKKTLLNWPLSTGDIYPYWQAPSGWMDFQDVLYERSTKGDQVIRNIVALESSLIGGALANSVTGAAESVGGVIAANFANSLCTVIGRAASAFIETGKFDFPMSGLMEIVASTGKDVIKEYGISIGIGEDYETIADCISDKRAQLEAQLDRIDDEWGFTHDLFGDKYEFARALFDTYKNNGGTVPSVG